MDNETIDESLLLRYLSHDVTNEEMRQVEEWLGKSGDNRQMARDLHYIMFASDILKNSEKISAEKAFAEMERKMKRKRVWKLCAEGFRSAAAILFIPLLISVGYLLIREGESSNQYVELRTNPGMTSRVVLPDGSKVWLNSNTYIKYPVAFTDESREVELDGEAYFSVVKDEDNIFRVHASDGDVYIDVLGTEFNVDAYQEHGVISTTLVSGSVKLSYTDRDNKRQSLKLQPQEKVVYDKENRNMGKKRVEVLNDISWKDGSIVLDNTPVKDMLWTLSKRFNVDFELGSSHFKSSSFTGVFNNQQLDVILEHLRIASGIRYSILPDTLVGDSFIKKRVILY